MSDMVDILQASNADLENKIPRPQIGTLVHYNGPEAKTQSSDGSDSSTICNLCRHIFEGLKSKGDSSRTYSVKSETALIEAAAKKGCHLCILLLAAYREPHEFGETGSVSSLPNVSMDIWLDGIYSFSGGLSAMFSDPAGQMSFDPVFDKGKKDSFSSYGLSSLDLEVDSGMSSTFIV